MALYEDFNLYGPLDMHLESMMPLFKEDFKSIFVDILQVHQAFDYFARILDAEARRDHKKQPRLYLKQFLDHLDSNDFQGVIPPYSSQRDSTESKKLAAHIANIRCYGLLNYEIMKYGLVIFTIKQRQLNLEGLPHNTRLLMETFWSIDRVMSEKILSYWLEKIGPALDIPNLLQSYDYLYLLINTTSKSEFIKKHITKPVMDLSKDPLNTGLFKLTSQGEIEHQKSLNVQVQHQMNLIYYPGNANIVSKVRAPDLKKFGKGHNLKELMQRKKVQSFAQKSEKEEHDPLKNPNLFPEIGAKLNSQAKLLIRAKFNSSNSNEGVYSDLQKIHALRFSEETVEDILASQKHLNKRFDSYRGFKYRYISELVNSNIANSPEYFKRDKEDGLELEALNNAQHTHKDLAPKISAMNSQFKPLLSSSKSIVARPTTSQKSIQIRKSAVHTKRPLSRALTRPDTASTKIDSILNEELSYFNKLF